MSGARWVALAAAAGLASSGILSGAWGWPREAFVGGHVVVVALVWVAYAHRTGVGLGTQLRRRWVGGLVVGGVVGALLVRSVLSQPASDAPGGLALAGSLAWLGVAYGAADALLLTVVPVLALYGARPPETLRHPGPRLGWALVALAGSMAVTAAYHLGFAEFRGATLAGPLVGNALVTLAYLASGSLLAPLLAHVLMHGAAVLHGIATTFQLPPHY